MFLANKLSMMAKPSMIMNQFKTVKSVQGKW